MVRVGIQIPVSDPNWPQQLTQQLWDILSVQGDWNAKVHPAGNLWGTADGAGNVTLTLDTNTYNDGWLPSVNRAYSSTMASDTWAATGAHAEPRLVE